jgi:hypothetical protein
MMHLCCSFLYGWMDGATQLTSSLGTNREINGLFVTTTTITTTSNLLLEAWDQVVRAAWDVRTGICSLNDDDNKRYFVHIALEFILFLHIGTRIYCSNKRSTVRQTRI